MVTSCCAYGCKYRYNKGDQISFFRFPRDVKRLALWVKAIGRPEYWVPSQGSSRLCGQHFQSGKPSSDENHPDYVPNVFDFNKISNCTLRVLERRQKAAEKRCRLAMEANDLCFLAPPDSGPGMSHLKNTPTTCCAVGCSMRKGTNLLSQVRLFGFPKDPKRRQLWESAVNRENWNATKNSRLCNFHFITGVPSSIESHPDYVPTLFKHCQIVSTNVAQKLSRYECCVKRSQVKDKSSILVDVRTLLDEIPTDYPSFQDLPTLENPTHESVLVNTGSPENTIRALQLKINALEARNAFLETVTRQTTLKRILGNKRAPSSKRTRGKNESLISNDGYNSKRPRLRPFAVPSLYLPVTENSEKCQAVTKKHACNKVSKRSVTHSWTTLQKSSLLNKAVNKLGFDPIKASVKDLKHSTIELWQKNEALKKDIEGLQKEGYKEDDLKCYIDALQKHQYIKNLGKRMMERLADVENTTITKVQEELGMS